jgi:hypothetical protein
MDGKIQLNLVIVLLVLLLLLTGYQAFKPSAPSGRYEYKIESIADADFQNSMNLLGMQGWEAVSARRASNGNETSPTFSYEIIFRRQLASGALPPMPLKTP